MFFMPDPSRSLIAPRALLRDIFARFRHLGESVARYEAEQILMHALGCSRTDLYTASDGAVLSGSLDSVESAVARRLTGEPLPYVLGRTHFFNTDIQVGPSVLIPRPETETLVERVLAGEPSREAVFLDFGTGSGAVAVALMRERPRWRAVASDISFPAILTAARNSRGKTLNVCGDRFSPFRPAPLFDFIVANPPYVSAAEMPELDKSVWDFEPHIALEAGIDGLEFVRCIARDAVRHLKRDGKVYCEIGSTQACAARDIFSSEGWRGVVIHDDLTRRPRVVEAAAPPCDGGIG
jgi:release factor glutamine methyltransferase